MGNGMDKVLDGLYIGSIHDSTDRKQLDENRITHILSVHSNPRPLVLDRYYLCIAVQDKADQELSQYFPDTNDFIHQARVHGGHVLVHCLAGVSRSVTVVIAYVMSVTKHTWRESFNIVHAAHRPAGPNFGFQRQLLRFQYEQVAEERERLRRTWPRSPHEDSAVCAYWLAVHEHWVLTGDMAAYESAVYPLPYNSFSVEAEGSSGQGTTHGAECDPDNTGPPSPKEPKPDKTLTSKNAHSKRNSTDSKAPSVNKSPGHKSPDHKSPDHKSPDHKSPDHKSHGHNSPGHHSPGHHSPGHHSPGHHSPGHKSPGHKSQRAQESTSVPDVSSVSALNELFKPSLSFTQEHVKKLKCSSRTSGNKKRKNANNSSDSDSSAEECSCGHMTSDFPEAFSEICDDESKPSSETTLDDLFASPPS